MKNNIKTNIPNDRLPDNMEGKKLFIPQFIPIWTDIRDKYNLNLRDCQMYGFIKFYIDKTANEFFFTDEQLMPVLGVKSRTPISRAISSLKKKGLIKVRNTTEVINGQVKKNRFITLNTLPLYSNEYIVTYSNEYINNNIYNNINKENNLKKEEQELFDFLDGKSQDNLPVPF